MNKNIFRILIPLLLLIFLNMLYPEIPDNSKETGYNILFLSSFGKDFPAQSLMEKGLRTSLSKIHVEHNVYYEFMDSTRGININDDYFIEYLRGKYQGIKIDYFIAWSFNAGLLLSRNRNLFPDAERILLEVPPEYLLSKNCYYEDDLNIVKDNDYFSTLNYLVRSSKPEKIIVIGEIKDSPGKNRLDTFKKAMKLLDSGITIEYLLDSDLDTIKEKLSKPFKKGTIVFYLLMFSDGKGRLMVPYDVLKIISENSSIPVYSYWDSLLGSGMVGGYLISLESLGEYLGTIIGNFEGNTKKHLRFSPMKYLYDYNSLMKWNISIDDLPEEAEIINMSRNLFEYYKWQILFICLFFLFFIVIFFLLNR